MCPLKELFKFLLISCTTLNFVCSQVISNKTALGKRQRFSASSFAFDLAGSKPDSVGAGGEGRRASVTELPSLEGIRISILILKKFKYFFL
jgi:hypothetical protein